MGSDFGVTNTLILFTGYMEDSSSGCFIAHHLMGFSTLKEALESLAKTILGTCGENTEQYEDDDIESVFYEYMHGTLDGTGDILRALAEEHWIVLPQNYSESIFNRNVFLIREGAEGILRAAYRGRLQEGKEEVGSGVSFEFLGSHCKRIC